MTKELVVAAYDKPLDWLHQVDSRVQKTVYRKGNAQPLSAGEIRVEPNVGRCVHTFFNHIRTRYDSLSDYTFFCQDFPFDHWGDMVDVINGEEESIERRASLVIGGYYGFHNNKFGSAWSMPPANQFPGGYALSCMGNGYPQHKGLNVDACWDKLFDSQRPAWYEFMPGGHFAITRDQVRLRSRNFYQKVCEILETEPDSPWLIERLECYIFSKNHTVKNF